jgi:hypothetical protein
MTNKRIGSSKPLRYVIQGASKDGSRWRTVKAYNSEDWEYRIVSGVMKKIARNYTGHFRILLIPFNILAESTQ